MKIEFDEKTVTLIREPDDPKFYGVKNAAGESKLFHAVVQKLRIMGHDVIKKRMHKDGHLVDDMQQYIRSRKPKGESKEGFAIWNPRWIIEGAEVPWNRDGKVVLTVCYDIFKPEAAPQPVES